MSPAPSKLAVGVDAEPDVSGDVAPPRRRRWFGPALVATDLFALGLSLLLLPQLTAVAIVAHLLVGEATIRSLRLRLTRVASDWATETVGMLRVGIILGVLSLVVSGAGPAGIPQAMIVILGSAAILWGARASYRGVVARLRRGGHGMTDVAVIGNPESLERLLGDLDAQPETGFRVHGVYGPRDVWQGSTRTWLGEVDDAVTSLTRLGVRHVIVDTGSLSGGESTRLIRNLSEIDVTVQVSTGLPDLDHRQITLRALGRTPMIYVESAEPSSVQVTAKRIMDIVGASVGLMVLAPLLLVFAILIKLEDRGPVFYRQDRVGRDGRLFPMLKLRSMRPNADRELGELQAQNVRSGPLFKVANDPRVTRIGRLIRASSIDEIPQFFNVLRGEMALIGPRPALPSEVAEFDDELVRRHRVAPGLTGLWQVEAREEEDFEHYRRLDLYYVHNFSLLLDITILLLTPLAVARRARTAIRPRVGGSGRVPAPYLD